MRATHCVASWHKRSYDAFLNEQLPRLIASRLPLEAFEVTPSGPYACQVAVTLAQEKGGSTLTVKGVAQPDDEGIFELDGRRLVVLPIASCEELDKAEIRCVGEQLHGFIEPRLAEAPPHLQWDEAMLKAWLPLDEWVTEFLDPSRALWTTATVLPDGPVHVLGEQNWLARREHLRRVLIPSRKRVIAPGQLGRVCPFCTPEGTNIGRVLSVALGADIRDGKLVITDERPEAALGLTASMVPLLQHNDPNRQVMGVNMMRQWVRVDGTEPALVQTGNEPDEPDFWCGANLLTAYVSWGEDTFEDAVVISESCARRFSFEGLVEPGDKVSNRHGAKGVISRILPDDEMPHLPDGTPVEIVCSFIALHARMNLGQLREAILGRIARVEGRTVVSAPFSGPTDAEIHERLARAGLPENGMVTLRMGRDGPELERPSTVGWVYWGLLHHLTRSKLYGSSAHKGMRQGHMEYYALRDVGAFETIAETFNTRAVVRKAADQLPAQLAAGEVQQSGPPSPALLELQRRLSAGGVRAKLERGELRFSLAEPDGEALELASPVSHPWLRELELKCVGVMPDMHEFQALADANAQLQRVLEGRAPESLVTSSRRNLERAVGRCFSALLRPEHLRPGGQVLFSGRTIIAPAANLGADQLGVPDALAWMIFGPLLGRELGDKQSVDRHTKRAAARLDDIMARSWVILNRAPTMETTALLAFRPVRVPERAFRLHPLACRLMNADFDGDAAAVFLPITAAGQREAEEKLSIAGHLQRDRTLIGSLVPGGDPIWGLAELGRTKEGLREIVSIAGADVRAPEGFVTRGTIVQAMEEVYTCRGAAETLKVLEQLVRLGFDAAKRSGASMAPLKGGSIPPVTEPKSMDMDDCRACMDEMDDELVSRTDYDSPEIGPQLLAVKSGARGTPLQLRNCLMGCVVADIRHQLVFIRHGFIEGTTPSEQFARTVGARRGLGETALMYADWGAQSAAAKAPKGYNVLVRAIRSSRPGAVLARAASTGAADPLTDLDARLFVGLSP